MQLGKMLGEDLEGMTLGDYAIRPQVQSGEVVDLDDQPPPGIAGLGLYYKVNGARNYFNPNPYPGVRDQQLYRYGLGAVAPAYYGYGYNTGQLLSSPQYNQQYYSGISSPYRYGTKNWWQWYATTYLPQYYNQQQIYSMLLQNPLYSTFGLPSGIYNPNQYGTYNPYTSGGYNYGYNQYTGSGYPYSQYPYSGYNQYGYPSGYGQYVYGQQGAYGAAQCQAQGGYYDYSQQQCYPQTGNYGGYGSSTGAPPNVVGQTVQQGVSALNAAGYTVWERLSNGQNMGNPPSTTATNRVVIDDQNGQITAQYIG